MKITILLFFVNLLFTINCYSQTGLIPGKPALAYWEVGNKPETVIVIHGGPAVSHEYLRPELDSLEKAAKIIYYDQRGCGKSETAENYSWTDHVSDIKRIINYLSKDKKVILVGSSWGSFLALLYAYSHPEDVKGLIISGTFEWLGKEMDAFHYHYGPPIKMKEIKIYENRLDTTLNEAGLFQVDTSQIMKTAISYGGPPHTKTWASIQTAPLLDSLKKVFVPVLIFNGSRDNCNVVDWGHIYVKILPNAELYTINGACHDPWLSNPRAFILISNSFIDNLNNK